LQKFIISDDEWTTQNPGIISELVVKSESVTQLNKLNKTFLYSPKFARKPFSKLVVNCSEGQRIGGFPLLRLVLSALLFYDNHSS
jgi:hypothetical protein